MTEYRMYVTKPPSLEAIRGELEEEYIPWGIGGAKLREIIWNMSFEAWLDGGDADYIRRRYEKNAKLAFRILAAAADDYAEMRREEGEPHE